MPRRMGAQRRPRGRYCDCPNVFTTSMSELDNNSGVIVGLPDDMGPDMLASALLLADGVNVPATFLAESGQVTATRVTGTFDDSTTVTIIVWLLGEPCPRYATGVYTT